MKSTSHKTFTEEMMEQQNFISILGAKSAAMDIQLELLKADIDPAKKLEINGWLQKAVNQIDLLK